VITLNKPEATLIGVGDLILHEEARWNEQMIDQLLLPMNVDIIKKMSLCPLWPQDMIMWYFTTSESSLFNQRTMLFRQAKNMHAQEVAKLQLSSYGPQFGSWKSLPGSSYLHGACAPGPFQHEQP